VTAAAAGFIDVAGAWPRERTFGIEGTCLGSS